MHHELSGTGVNSTAELMGYRHRPAALGMLFSAILPGSGIPYVTYGEAQNWTVEYNDRKSKKGNGNFWTIAIFGGAAALLANQESKAYDEELDPAVWNARRLPKRQPSPTKSANGDWPDWRG